MMPLVSDPKWPLNLWRLAHVKERLPAGGMVPVCAYVWCVVRLSNVFLEELKRIAEKNGVLPVYVYIKKLFCLLSRTEAGVSH